MRETTASADTSSPDLESVVLEHAYRGVWLQTLLRCVLVAFVVLTLVFVPPVHDRPASDVIVAAYALWAIGVGVWSWRGGPALIRFAWLNLLVDLAALAALALLAGVAAQQSWTADVLISGFFLIPLLAATQLRPGVCAIVVGPTLVAFFATSVATKSSNQEPWGAILLTTLVLVGVGLGCIGLSYLQRSRVATIGGLVRQRTGLLSELTNVQAQERRRLAESLHDGALQYVLAARQDLEDARELGDREAFARLDVALTETGRLLRSTVAELHPAVLEHAGLAQALRELVRNAESTGGFSPVLDLDGWSDELRTPADALLYDSARELLSNVVKHAHASTVRISLSHEGDIARLVIADDGRGIPDGAVERSLARGHIGLASYRVRVEAAGGVLELRPGVPSGAIAEVEVPCRCEAPPPAGSADRGPGSGRGLVGADVAARD